MTDKELAGIGVLVTRPKHQATDFVSAITQKGGVAIELPVMEVIAHDAAKIEHDVASLLEADIAIFVSANAVRLGLAHAGTAKIAAIGPATAIAIRRHGREVDIQSVDGFDSEHLLNAEELQDVHGKVIRIVRGNVGRELLARTLRARGAIVEYLAVYRRQIPEYSGEELAKITEQWRAGKVDVVTIMSVESLQNLLKILPRECQELLVNTSLVTPAQRVVQEAAARLPGIPTTLAKGPQVNDIIDAILACGNT
jgi:uroporphyrinogen-III synthase